MAEEAIVKLAEWREREGNESGPSVLKNFDKS